VLGDASALTLNSPFAADFAKLVPVGRQRDADSGRRDVAADDELPRLVVIVENLNELALT